MKTFFISTPIYYVNAKPHLGHAYSTIVADSLARFHRLSGEDVFFLTGTDEHGDKIVEAAEKRGLQPAEFTDEISGLFRDLWPTLQIENTDFIRTTMDHHKKCVQAILQKVYDAGDIYFGEYGGHYCFGCERFYTEKELVDGCCPDHKTKPTFIQEKNYFFKMSKYLESLRQHIETNPDFIRPERYRSEVLGLLREDLGDLCISRPKSRLTWGIELPFDKDFVCYVWFDALVNYIAALGHPDGDKFRRYWPNANHLIAKDILKPHAVFWPTMLMSAGVPLYQHLNVHGYWLVGGTKMSKSLGNVVEPLAMAEKYGPAAFRYFLLREMTFGQDSSFSEEALVSRLNADLANDLGNLYSRALTMTHKYFGGVVPTPGRLNGDDSDVVSLAADACANFSNLFGRLQFAKALDSLWELVRHLNKYIDQSAPWTLFKNNETERLGTVIYVVLEGMRKVALRLWPVMPVIAERMCAQLGLAFDLASVDLAGDDNAWGRLTPGLVVAERSNLFPRVDLAKSEDKPAKPPKPAKPQSDSKVKSATDRCVEVASAVSSGTVQPQASAPDSAAVPTTSPQEIDIADFQKLDLRVATVLTAAPVKGADKLLLLTVDAGEESPRQIVSGIAEFYKPEDLTGRQVVIIANLKPRKLRGVTSMGMVLAVRKEGGLELLGTPGAVAPGSKVS